MSKIYLFLGDEPLIIENKIKALISKIASDEYNTNTYDLDEVNVNKAVQDAITMPFISDRKVVLIRNPYLLTSNKTEIDHDVDGFIHYINNPFASTTLIIDAGGLNLDNRKEVVKLLKKKAEINNTKALSGVEAVGWLKRQFSLADMQITDEAARLFFDRTGNDLLNAKNEVNKLINYCGNKKLVTSDDVNNVVTREIESEVFALTNAIMQKDKEKIILIYKDLRKSGKDAMQLIGLVSRSLADIFIASKLLKKGVNQSGVAKAMNISSGRAYYLLRDAKSFSEEDLEQNILNLANTDYKIKTGQIDAFAALELFLFAL